LRSPAPFAIWNNTMTYCCRMMPLSMLVLVLGASGCTFVNQELNSLDAPIGQRRLNHTHAAMLNASDPLTNATTMPTTRPSAS